MGNCLFGGMSDPDAAVIKVITSNGGIMEFYAPITVSFITNEFPGHGIFPSHDLFWKPLCHLDELAAGQSYYLLPLNNPAATTASADSGGDHIVRQGHVRSRSAPTTPSPAPYRMSSAEPFSSRTSTSNSISRSTTSSSSSSSRFWKVKLVISPDQLLEILSQEARTKEFIESVRIVAKCGVAAAAAGGGGGKNISSEAAGIVSDHWSLSSSGRSNPSKIDALLVDTF